MLHAKFQHHRPSGSIEDFLKLFAIYSHGGHLGHVNYHLYKLLFPRRLHMKFGFDWPSSFREIDL